MFMLFFYLYNYINVVYLILIFLLFKFLFFIYFNIFIILYSLLYFCLHFLLLGIQHKFPQTIYGHSLSICFSTQFFDMWFDWQLILICSLLNYKAYFHGLAQLMMIEFYCYYLVYKYNFTFQLFCTAYKLTDNKKLFKF